MTTELLEQAVHALRSYQYGNISPELAESVADAIEQHLAGHDSHSGDTNKMVEHDGPDE